jgi:hypothetical protein
MPIKRMGLVTLFNGIDVLQSRYFIKISCKTYIEKFCMKYQLSWLKDTTISARPTPMPTSKSFLDGFQSADGDPDEKVQEQLKKRYGFGYRNGSGEDIHCQIPNNVSKPQHNPLSAHAYVDSDWATCIKTRRSMTGVTIKLAGGTIAYKTKLQQTVVLSSTEAELMAAWGKSKRVKKVRCVEKCKTHFWLI